MTPSNFSTSGLSSEEIRLLQARLAEEEYYRAEVAQRLETIRAEIDLLEELAERLGPIPCDPIPAYGFIPGQLVDHAGRIYCNISRAVLGYPPAVAEDGWEPVPDEPEPQPEPEPEIPLIPLTPAEPVEDEPEEAPEEGEEDIEGDDEEVAEEEEDGEGDVGGGEDGPEQEEEVPEDA